MRTLGWLMTRLGLVLPLLAIVLQLADPDQFTVGRMLILAVAGFCLFYIGRIIEGYSR